MDKSTIGSFSNDCPEVVSFKAEELLLLLIDKRNVKSDRIGKFAIEVGARSVNL